MALFTPAQQQALSAAATALSDIMQQVNQASQLLDDLRRLQAEPMINGNADGNAIYATANTQWRGFKSAIVSTAARLPQL